MLVLIVASYKTRQMIQRFKDKRHRASGSNDRHFHPTMSSETEQKQDGMEQKSVSRIATISQRIRGAIRAALPAPPEQFFHVMVPGKVVNFSVCLSKFILYLWY